MSHKLDFTKLSTFDTFDWAPLPTLSVDENFLDLALMVCRKSCCVQGFMGCLLVDPKGDVEPTALSVAPTTAAPAAPATTTTSSSSSSSTTTTTTPTTPTPLPLSWYESSVLAASINTPFYKALTSDIHAEINAISACARAGIKTVGATAYISMPPCKDCFQALVQAGVKRVVSRKRACDTVERVAGELSVELVEVADTEGPDGNVERRLRVVRDSGRDKSRDQIEADRKKRKLYKQQQSEEKKKRRGEREAADKLGQERKAAKLAAEAEAGGGAD
ncbi:hypothetical protein TeGR_g14846 [Tetraparma gracilis]|uniref:CMP/dCMP-type deaminase domain-containing protein n=1 Tax=Tetraparma gracilis TaxID=2962635 RepID=A0ABQ6NC27_9STRA|nr:hypothetical protein TeGR_g14846 [Tetraparma gracilis]